MLTLWHFNDEELFTNLKLDISILAVNISRVSLKLLHYNRKSQSDENQI